ncbi:alcohol dehydrogenase catalytic domain-containing protein [Microbispora sp. ZYX-F-249]|uniref:Alcohol dehydrogenase catalytic domain-containing protein n=1 Tax=Microbispora maris TaxID=3144104 RepID=A0ABV0ANZ5_9ACTN
MTAALPSSVRSYHVNSGDGIDGLSLRTHQPRMPGVGEVAVVVHAASLSFRDLLVLRGRYVLPVKPDVIPVSDGAGQVVAVGPGVRRVRPGDRVTATLFPQWLDGPLQPSSLPQLGGSLDGMLTELAVMPEQARPTERDHRRAPASARHRPSVPVRGSGRRVPLLRIGQPVRKGRHRNAITGFSRFLGTDCFLRSGHGGGRETSR